MAQQQLDGAHIGAGFQQVCGEGMTQRVRRDGFLNPAVLSRLLASLEHSSAGHRLTADSARKQPVVGAHDLKIRAQRLQQPRREHDVAVLLSLTLFHTQHHALAINVVDFEVHCL